jgi:hypothetical protein
MVRTRKPAPPVLSVEMRDGSVVPLWCTFSTQQVCLARMQPYSMPAAACARCCVTCASYAARGCLDGAVLACDCQHATAAHVVT